MYVTEKYKVNKYKMTYFWKQKSITKSRKLNKGEKKESCKDCNQVLYMVIYFLQTTLRGEPAEMHFSVVKTDERSGQGESTVS